MINAEDSSNELTRRKEVFQDVQKAYGYLTNPLTKVIYDEFGIPGLVVYEKSKNKFQDLQAEIRGLNIEVDDQMQPLIDTQDSREQDAIRRIRIEKRVSDKKIKLEQ